MWLAESAGLGLSMEYGFVTQSGGEVRIESTPQVGTRVTMRLPRLAASAAPETLSRRPAVLLVEDDAGIRRLTAAMITLMGYEVHETGLLEEARALALTVRPQVLVTDIVLGQADFTGIGQNRNPVPGAAQPMASRVPAPTNCQWRLNQRRVAYARSPACNEVGRAVIHASRSAASEAAVG